MNQPASLHDDDSVLEELVAYLDHELEEDERLRVERRLAEDPSYREQLVSLQRSWDMLDEMPRATVDESFTQSTVEIVALSTAQEAEGRRATEHRRRIGGWIAAAAGAVIAAIASFQVVSTRLARPNEALAADLPVIERIDDYLYLGAGGVSFVRELDHAGLFPSVSVGHEDEAPHDADEADEMSAAELLLQFPDSVPAEVKIALDRKRERFERMEPAERDRLSRLHEEFASQPDAARLWTILRRYNDWMNELPATHRSDLLALTPQQRLEEVQKIVAAQEAERFRNYAVASLTDDDRKRIHEWLVEMARSHKDVLWKRLSERTRRDLERWYRSTPEERRGYFIVSMLVMRQGSEELVHVFCEEDLLKLIDSLGPAAQEAYRSADSDARREELLARWIRAAVYSKLRPSTEEMQKFVMERATPEDRERIENTPHEHMNDVIRDLFNKYRGGFVPRRPPFSQGGERGGDAPGRSAPVEVVRSPSENRAPGPIGPGPERGGPRPDFNRGPGRDGGFGPGFGPPNAPRFQTPPPGPPSREPADPDRPEPENDVEAGKGDQPNDGDAPERADDASP